MRSQATETARRILEAGGKAFDAAVGGQAVLGLTDFAGIVVDSTTGVLSAGADPRVETYAWAW
jgi:gamma-glutamyltranspeptidase